MMKTACAILLRFECIEAVNGLEMVEKTRNVRLDIILSDLFMPVMAGFEAIQRIHHDPKLRHIPIVTMSASVSETEQQKSQIAGCRAFLQKPIEMTQLFHLLKTLLDLEWIYGETNKSLPSLLEPKMPENAQQVKLPPLEELRIFLGSPKEAIC